MKNVSFIEESKVIEKIIHQLKLTFEAEGTPQPRHVQQKLLMAAGMSGEYL